jgi:phosphomannomutase
MDISSVFKAYDVRGKVGSELNTQTVTAMARAFGSWLPDDGPVAVGRDMRPDSTELAAAMIAGLRAAGRDVWDIGEVTSDMIYFTVGKFGLAGGAMITASHNPGEYNGIKFCRSGARPVGIESGLADIRDVVVAGDFSDALSDAEGSYTEKDVVEPWIQHVLSFIDVDALKPLKVVVDAGNGMAGKIFPEIEPYIPLDVTEMYFELDGTFPNHVANPIEPENIVDLVERVKTEGADLGIAFDGDGDRAVLIDENANVLSGTVLTALLAEYFLSKEPGATVLYNATCGWIVPETIEAHGGKAVRTKVGHSFIKADMRTHDALFAGESSGHYYFRDNYMADSGLIAAIVALAVISQRGEPVSAIANQYRAYHQIPETNFVVEDKAGIIQRLSDTFSEHTQDMLDGLTVYTDDAWFNVRPSNTEPILRLNAEGKQKSSLDTIVTKIKKIIQSY